MKTLNQLIEVFENFSTNHGQLHSFGVGDIWEAGMSSELIYPTLWIQPTESRAIKGASGYAKTNTKFRVFILDRVKKDEANESEVLSDTTQIAHDLVKHIDSDPQFLTGEGYTFNAEDIIMEYVTEKLKDEVSGVYLQMSFEQPFNMGCTTPLNS